LPAATIVAAVLFFAGCSNQSSDQTCNTLKDAFSGDFKIGCAINSAIADGRDSIGTALLLANFNAISPENDLKPEVLHPTPDRWNWRAADRYATFGRNNNMFVLGHTLIWHNQTPAHFFNHTDGTPKNHEEMKETLRTYIETVTKHFHGKIDAWDVVNEIIGDDGNYRKTVWTDAFDGDGDEIVKLAFRYASEYTPGTELYYNDFNVWRPSKRDGIVRMIRMLQEEGIRIDGVGIQAHWGLNYPENEYIEAAIDSLSSLGIKVMITELDIDVLPISREGQVIGRSLHDPLYQLEEFEKYLDPYKEGLPDDVQQKLTSRYKEIMQIFYDRRDKIDRVTFWGLNDAMSWKNGSPIPSRTNYPLLWNRDYSAKPALEAILSIPQHI